MKKFRIPGCLLIIMALVAFLPAFSAYAQGVAESTLVSAGPVEKISDYFSTQTLSYSDGTSISRDVISGPPTPPPGYEFERTAVQLPAPGLRGATSTLTVPAYDWVFGCSAVSGSMIAAYYDRNGYSKIYTGPTNGGVMPLDSSVWGTWTDGTDTYPNNPLIASHNGSDGRTTRGSIDDYWILYGSDEYDPYMTGHWSQHKWKDAIGDYMKTSQYIYGNSDGSTTFYNYTSIADQLTCADMKKFKVDSHTISYYDGTYGRKLFYEARGYKVTDCYNQKTDNKVSGGFSFIQYKAEIDAGRPVFLNLAGHSIVGVGYDDSTSPETVYIHDTWDYSNHSMPWGGSYSGMELQSVSIVSLKEVHPSISSLSPSSGTFGNTVIIKGKYFGEVEGSVTFNGTPATVSSWSDISITCTVPVSAATGSVVVTTDLGGPSVGKKFTVKNPSISSLSPSSGAIGATVIIKGKYFGTTEGTVTFNGTAADISDWSDTSITCTVPMGAATGSVVVTNQVGPSNAKKFTVK